MKFPWRPRTIYMIPNRYGFTLLGVFIIFILGGAAYTNNLVFMMAFFVLSFGFTAILQTSRTIRNIEIISINLISKSVEQNTTGQIVVQNPTNHYKPSFEIEIKDFNAKIHVPELQPNESKMFTFSLKLPEKRGLYTIKKLAVQSSSPYGLFKGWMYLKVDFPFVVYPRLSGRGDLPMEQDTMGESFSGHRQFVSGDNFSRVDWKIFAKTQDKFIKEFKDSSTKKIIINWDKVKIANSEDRISQIALWLDRAYNSHLEFALVLPGFESTLQTGQHHFHSCMKELSTLKV